MCRNQILARHHFVDAFIQTTLETQVSVGDNTHQMVLVINHRNASDVVILHNRKGILHRASASDGHRVIDHPILGTFYCGYVMRLFIDAHILMDDADTAFAGDGNSHRRFGDGVHCGCYKRNFQRNTAREFRF